MANYGVVYTTNLSGCDNYSFQSAVAIENGSLVTKGNLVANEREIYEAVAPATATLATEKVYLVANPAWSYDDSYAKNQNEDQFINVAGNSFRVYELKANKRFKVTDYSITPIDGTTPVAVGQYVGLANGSMKPVASVAKPAGSAFVGKIIAVDQTGFGYSVGSAGTVNTITKMVLIEVVANA